MLSAGTARTSLHELHRDADTSKNAGWLQAEPMAMPCHPRARGNTLCAPSSIGVARNGRSQQFNAGCCDSAGRQQSARRIDCVVV